MTRGYNNLVKRSALAALGLLTAFLATALAEGRVYPWLDKCDPAQSIAARIDSPENFARVELAPGGFGDWLRHLPLKPGRPRVMLFDGSPKVNQSAHYAVVDIDVGKRDLQQCADAIMRLRAEYLYSVGRFEDIHFNFTSGLRFEYSKWREGYRPVGYKKNAKWRKSARPDHSRAGFMKYMTLVFSYAGTHSLSLELAPIPDIDDMRVGDVFIHGGFPGHAVIVVDMAENKESGAKLFMSAQSYMPAQDVHILRNPSDGRLSPWYSTDFGERLYTPEWVFDRNELMRFRQD